ncbi:Gfo/Idh/MocA family protein [Streptomyces fulvoviolaceus]|uniref:Gfo/Idh/MocA family protein n=1 Tax=Streptomyces fulvoviolaceus TaxID=285535 RepID=UPI0004C90181|nr:Gfo/Idh/MocA family oxidoreductase [Streptomyces fulvoviolaceus]MCT9078191.1 Gfo/Idh/MocA family oxidoreductase [Streptomyces fulvoviolaceus]
MTSLPLRAGLVGLGAMGRNHARVLANLGGVDLVGVVEPMSDAEAAYGAPVFSTVEELIALGADYVVVACPTALHAEVGLKLAEAGICALIEKPLAHTVQAARRLVEAFRSRGLVAGVGHIERFNPALLSLRTRLETGELGDVYQVVTRRQGPYPHRIADVGVVEDLASHDIDLTSWLTSQEYASVTAHTVSKNGRSHEDMVAVTGQLADSTVVNHLVNWLSPLKERTTVVTGEHGCFVVDTLSTGLTYFANGEENMVRCPVPKREPLVVEHEHFRDAVRGKPAEIVPLHHGLRTVRVSAAVIESAQRGITVTLRDK